jgi:hypothetical protein
VGLRPDGPGILPDLMSEIHKSEDHPSGTDQLTYGPESFPVHSLPDPVRVALPFQPSQPASHQEEQCDVVKEGARIGVSAYWAFRPSRSLSHLSTI